MSIPKNLPKGWLTDEAILYLQKLIGMVADLDGDLLEVGSYYGRSSIVIGTEAKKLKQKLYCIGTWNTDVWADIAKGLPANRKKYIWEGEKGIFEAFKANIRQAKLATVVKPIVGTTQTAIKGWDKPLRFVFVDGCHYYNFVRSDAKWREHIVNGGIIAFHDYGNGAWTDVKRAVCDEMDNDKQFELVGLVHTTKAFRKE